MPYLHSLLAAYRDALSAGDDLPLRDARALLAAATSAPDRGRALAAIALALVRAPVMPNNNLSPLAVRRRYLHAPSVRDGRDAAG